MNEISAGRWWGEYELAEDERRWWTLGWLLLGIERKEREWRIGYEASRSGDAAVPGTNRSVDELEFSARYVFAGPGAAIIMTPALADRPVVTRPVSPLNVPPGEQATLFVSSPVWVRVEAAGPAMQLADVPVARPSDTWFGRSTREGELCYATRTHGRLRLEDVPDLDAHMGMLIRRVIYYLVLILFLVSALRELGFNLGVLLGAAGILSVAVGFASQTSASNLISGLFLLSERPFAVGDVVTVGSTAGEVMSVDLLSVKLRTFDNRFVRIPNETMIKSEVITLTKFPIRRYDVQVGIAYKEDITKAREVLMAVAERNPLCLEEPKPLFVFLGFGDSSLNFQFSVWAAQENFLEVRNSIQEEIKLAFDQAGIEIPFPHRTLYTGSATEPFPVRMVEDRDAVSAAVTGARSENP